MIYWSKWMLVNSGGRKSVSLTLMVIACVIVFVRLLLSGVVIKLSNGNVIMLGQPSVSSLALFITPFLALYFWRRMLDDKKEEKDLNNGLTKYGD